MSKISHDPSEYVRGLQQLLVSDKKRIGFLFGAGTSLAKKNDRSIFIPAISEMTKTIESELSKTSIFKNAILEIRSEIGDKKFNIESFLTNIENKRNVLVEGEINGLTRDGFSHLILETKKEIIKLVSVHTKIMSEEAYENLIHVDFAEWIGRANRKYPIEIFTTNYDFLFEIGLEYKSIPYYDGFTGSFEPFFNADSIERNDFLPSQTKLWKIHGSLGWKSEKGKVLRKEPSESDILIYPSMLKYNNSRKQPYIALMDRLSNFIKLSDTILVVCGYSFGDEHINERILTALRANSSTHVFVLYYDVYFDGYQRKYTLTEDCYLAKLAKENSRLSVLACRSAVIGSQYGAWKLKNEPDVEDTINVNAYFDEDGPSNESDELEIERIGQERWTGCGELKIGDFKAFTLFLKSMITSSGGNIID